MDSEKLSKDLKGIIDGLSLMILVTGIWTAIAGIAMDNWAYRLPGIIFVILIIFFISYYIKFNTAIKLSGTNQPAEETPDEKKKNKWFIIIFISEGVLIFLVINVLVNINLAQFFIPCFALIVGLHFYPLGVVFKRTVHYFVGTWITIIAIAGIVLTANGSFHQNYITAFTGYGCAAGTSAMALYMVYYGNKHGKTLLELNK
jgi:MFS family permease